MPRRCRVTCTAAKSGSPTPMACFWSSSTMPGKSRDGCSRNACSPLHATDQGASVIGVSLMATTTIAQRYSVCLRMSEWFTAARRGSENP